MRPIARLARGCVALALLAGTPGPAAHAQGAAAPGAASPMALAPPYETQLLRLAEIMGALHLLSTVCASPEAGSFRREMQALLEAEAASLERRERLVESFNRGYRGFEQNHRSCTPAARLSIRRFAEEGRKLTGDLNARFGN